MGAAAYASAGQGLRVAGVLYDNSENNPYNPNPNIEIKYGPQTTDEMAVSFMGFITDAKSDPNRLLPRQRGRAAAAVE